MLYPADTPPAGGKEAQIHYADNDYQIVRMGTYVRCAVTGRHIPLDELKYWSPELQEAYATPEAVLKRFRREATINS